MKKMGIVIGCVAVLAVAGAGFALAQSPTIKAGGDRTEAVGGPGVSSTEAATPDMATDVAADAESGVASSVDNGAATEAEGTAVQKTQIWGPVVSIEDGSIMMNNESGNSFQGAVVLHIGENTRVLEGENGFPTQVEDIKVGDMIYAYIGPAMTMSLPPQTTAEMIICKVPAEMKAPERVQVKSMILQENGDWVLTSTEDVVYNVSGDCPILPFLTRNIVRLQDVTEDSTLLVWSDAENIVQKMVLFAQDVVETN